MMLAAQEHNPLQQGQEQEEQKKKRAPPTTSEQVNINGLTFSREEGGTLKESNISTSIVTMRTRMITFIPFIDDNIPKINTLQHEEITYHYLGLTDEQNKGNQGNCRNKNGMWRLTIQNRRWHSVYEVTGSQDSIPQYGLGTCILIIKVRATSNKCLFLRSATPFCCGVWAQEVWWIMPCKAKNCEFMFHVFKSIVRTQNTNRFTKLYCNLFME